MLIQIINPRSPISNGLVRSAWLCVGVFLILESGMTLILGHFESVEREYRELESAALSVESAKLELRRVVDFAGPKPGENDRALITDTKAWKDLAEATDTQRIRIEKRCKEAKANADLARDWMAWTAYSFLGVALLAALLQIIRVHRSAQKDLSENRITSKTLP